MKTSLLECRMNAESVVGSVHPGLDLRFCERSKNVQSTYGGFLGGNFFFRFSTTIPRF
jgi:hypothetical protein